MERKKTEHSVIDSLDTLYKFLVTKYGEELSLKFKKEKKLKTLCSKQKPPIPKEEGSRKPPVSSGLCPWEETKLAPYNSIFRKPFPKKIRRKKANNQKCDNKMPAYSQTVAKKKNNKALDFHLNVLSQNAKQQSMQTCDDDRLENEKVGNYSSYLKENFDLVTYLTINHIKTKTLTIWAKRLYLSVLRKMRENGNKNFVPSFHDFSDPNDTVLISSAGQNIISPPKKPHQNTEFYQRRPEPVFFFSESQSYNESSNSSVQLPPQKSPSRPSSSSSNQNDLFNLSSNDKDMLVDIVLSENSNINVNSGNGQ